MRTSPLSQALHRGAPFLFLLPTLLPLLAFTYLPFYLSAREGLPALGSLLNTENLNALRVTALYLLLTVPLSVGLGLAGALAVEGDSRLRLLARTLIFHPVVLPTVAFAVVFLYLLNPLGPLIRNRLDPFLFWWSTPKALPCEADIPDELLLALSGTLQGGFL
jgi:ABC-type sugar transport system permease subunit